MSCAILFDLSITATIFNERKKMVAEAVANVSAGGGTNLSGGLFRGIELGEFREITKLQELFE